MECHILATSTIMHCRQLSKAKQTKMNNRWYGVYLLPVDTECSSQLMQQVQQLFHDDYLPPYDHMKWGRLFHITVAGFKVLNEKELLQLQNACKQVQQCTMKSQIIDDIWLLRKKGCGHDSECAYLCLRNQEVICNQIAKPIAEHVPSYAHKVRLEKYHLTIVQNMPREQFERVFVNDRSKYPLLSTLLLDESDVTWKQSLTNCKWKLQIVSTLNRDDPLSTWALHDEYELRS